MDQQFNGIQGQNTSPSSGAPQQNTTLKTIIGVLAAIIIVGGGYFLFSSGRKSVTISDYLPTQGGTAVFPWENYPALIEVDPSQTADVVVASRVELGTNAVVRTVITKDLDMGTGARVTGEAYTLTSVDMGTNSAIGELVLLDSTSVSDAFGTTIGLRTLLSNDAWVARALQELPGSAPTGGQTAPAPQAGGAQPTSPAPAPSPTPAPAPAPVAHPFEGYWSGTFAPSKLGCPGGSISLTVSSGGSFDGIVVTSFGDTFYGGGSVSKSGAMSGGWTTSVGSISFTGQLAGNSGNGSYNDGSGCTGTFSIRR